MEFTTSEGLVLPEAYRLSARSFIRDVLKDKTNNASNYFLIGKLAKIFLNFSQYIRLFLERGSRDPTRHMS